MTVLRSAPLAGPSCMGMPQVVGSDVKAKLCRFERREPVPPPEDIATERLAAAPFGPCEQQVIAAEAEALDVLG